MENNKYGYKVCYREFGKSKLKIHLICNVLDGAEWHVRYYENHQQKDRHTGNLIREPTWEIIPIKTYLEYKRLWKGCPFQDALYQ